MRLQGQRRHGRAEGDEAMSDRPIIFSAPMVRALLDGRKMQTRRVLKPLPEAEGQSYVMWPVYGYARVGFQRCGSSPLPDRAAPYAPGDRLWVREAWACHWATDDQPPREMDPDLWSVRYLADDHIRPAARDGSLALKKQCAKVRSSFHMPRWASRLTLLVTDVRVTRLQEISEADAVAEGIEQDDVGLWRDYAGSDVGWGFSVESFRSLWNSLHGPDAWAANPWVSAVSFTVERRNIDAVPQ